MSESIDGSERFRGRVEAYTSGRPDYPQQAIDWILQRVDGARPRVADIGAGTGIFTRQLCAAGAMVDAVEPNAQMRSACARALSDMVATAAAIHPGSAERTGLTSGSVDLVTAAQAAHWFSPQPTVIEWRRILRPGGRVALIWNDWRLAGGPFNRAYGRLVAGTAGVDGRPLVGHPPVAPLPPLIDGTPEACVIDNPVSMGWERLVALAASASYLPADGDPSQADFLPALDRIFAAHQQRGTITMLYRTHVFIGHPAGGPVD